MCLSGMRGAERQSKSPLRLPPSLPRRYAPRNDGGRRRMSALKSEFLEAPLSQWFLYVQQYIFYDLHCGVEHDALSSWIGSAGAALNALSISSKAPG